MTATFDWQLERERADEAKFSNLNGRELSIMENEMKS